MIKGTFIPYVTENFLIAVRQWLTFVFMLFKQKP